jgi:hypothetical protein
MTKESVVIRAGDLQADRRLAIDMLARCLNPAYDDARFDWVYRENPHGLGRLWVASDPEKGAVVGIAGAFPRRMCLSGREELAWVLGDFCVSDAYRSVGPALALQRACLAEVSGGAIPFCYDFPNSGMLAVYRRLGINPLGKMVRLSRPLRVEAQLRELSGSPAVGRFLNSLAEVILAPRGSRRVNAGDLAISLQDGPFGNEFTELYRRYAGHRGIMVERSAEYLNWRYVANPVHRHEVMIARRAGRLAGYAVLREDPQMMNLIDVFAGGDVETVSELIQSTVALAWHRGLASASISLLESSAWIEFLKRVGFKQRETSPVVVYASREAWPKVGDQRDWLLLLGDRDS